MFSKVNLVKMIVKHFITVSSQNNKIKVKFLVTPSICCKQWHSMSRCGLAYACMAAVCNGKWEFATLRCALYNRRLAYKYVEHNMWVIRFNSIRARSMH